MEASAGSVPSAPSSAPHLAFSADLQRRMASLGIDDAGRDWLIKVLNPVNPTKCAGIPDASYQACLRPEWRDQCVISSPPGLTTPTWDLCVVMPPVDNTAAIWCAGDAGTDFRQGTGLQRGTCVRSGLEVFGTAVLGYLTDTAATAPQLHLSQLRSVQRIMAYRTSYRSTTAYLTASSLYDQGTLYASQLNRPYDGMTGLQAAGGGPITLPYGMCSYGSSVPLDENEIAVQDPKYVCVPAKTGAYIPHRLSGPVQPFVSLNSGRGFFVIAPAPDNPAAFPTYSMANTAYLGASQFVWPVTAAPLSRTAFSGSSVVLAPPAWVNMVYSGNFSGEAAPDLGTLPLDTGVDNVYTGVLLFRGLDPHASVTLRFVAGMEIIPMYDAPSREYVEPAPKFSPKAMELYYATCHEMANVYPSSFNALGTIVSAISSVLSRLWPVAKAVLPVAIRAFQDSGRTGPPVVERVVQRPKKAKRKSKGPPSGQVGPAPKRPRRK